MANLPESASFNAGVYQIETTDAVIGGVNGISNLQAKALANRTTWLKQQVDALNLLKGKGVAAFSIANSYVAGEIVDYQKNIYRANTTVTPGAWNASQWNKLLGTAAESELASVAPLMNGSAAVGTSTLLARQDHVHPADTGREPAIAVGTTAQFWRGDKTWQDFAAAVRGSALTGLSTVTSTVVAAADTILVAIGKLQAQITLRAPLADPTFTGVPAAPTPANGTNTTQLATTAFVQSQIASSVPAASEIVAGKVELATAAETTTGTDNTRAVHPAGLKVELDKKAPLASPALTGTPSAPTADAGTNNTQLATTAFVQTQISTSTSVPAASETVAGKVELATAAETTTGTDNARAVHPAGLKVELDKKAPLASPNLTGTPTAPTAAAGTNTTQLATTDFVTTADNLKANINSPTFTGVPSAPTPASGTRSTAIATMQNFANEFGSSFAPSGWQRLPSGLIIQWGVVGGGTGTRTFPIAFPTAFLSIALACQANDTSGVTGTPSVTGFSYAGASGSRYIALGY